MSLIDRAVSFHTFGPKLLFKIRKAPNIQKAWSLAILLHLLLAFTLPGMPEFKIPGFSRDAALNVFLRREEEPEIFEQSLNQSDQALDVVQELQEAQAEARSIEPQEDEVITDEAPELENSNSDVSEQEPAGKSPESKVRPSILISRSIIQRFTDNEAILYAEQNPEEIERFRRSFASFRSLRRRNETASYQNRFGDVYVQNSSSSGDVCFVQQQDRLANEPATRTVYFYRCDSKPKLFELTPKG